MSNKIGFNILSFHPDKARTHILDEAAGLWRPDKNSANALILGRYQDLGVKYLRYGSGNWNREFSFNEAMIHGFTLGNFIDICRYLDANPIITCDVFQPVQETVDVLTYMRNIWDGEIYLEVGNESWLGANSNPVNTDNWPRDYWVEQYVETFNKIYEAISNKQGIHFGVPVMDIEQATHPKYPNYQTWNAGLKVLSSKFSWMARHVYSADHSDMLKSLQGTAAEWPDKNIGVTEWNHPAAKDIGAYEYYDWVLTTLRVMEGLQPVFCHCMWDGSCGEKWPLFGVGGVKTVQWLAYEAFAKIN